MGKTGKTQTPAMEVEITITGKKMVFNEWTLFQATVNGKKYQGSMVYFDEPSKFGIRNGRISKLGFYDLEHTEEVGYDRGWSVRPKTPEAKAVLAAIVKHFN
jgi:hypothetical protein